MCQERMKRPTLPKQIRHPPFTMKTSAYISHSRLRNSRTLVAAGHTAICWAGYRRPTRTGCRRQPARLLARTSYRLPSRAGYRLPTWASHRRPARAGHHGPAIVVQKNKDQLSSPVTGRPNPLHRPAIAPHTRRPSSHHTERLSSPLTGRPSSHHTERQSSPLTGRLSSPHMGRLSSPYTGQLSSPDSEQAIVVRQSSARRGAGFGASGQRWPGRVGAGWWAR